MPGAAAGDCPVEGVGHRGGRDPELGGGFALRHDFAEAQQLALEAQGVAAHRHGPGDVLLEPAVSRAADLARPVVQHHAEPVDRDVAPVAHLAGGATGTPAHELAAPATSRA